MKTINKGMDTKTGGNDLKNRNSSKKVINMDTTPATQKVKAKAGTTLHNEGTNISYEEER